MEADGVEVRASIARRGLIPLMWCWGRLCEPPLIHWVWREGGLLVVSTVDVPIVDMLDEVPHVMHPAVNVTHLTVHVVHVLGGLSGKGGEVDIHLNHFHIEHLVNKRERKMIFPGCRIQLPVIYAHSPSRHHSCRYQRTIFRFYHGCPSFLCYNMHQAHPFAVRDWINDPGVQELVNLVPNHFFQIGV
jgi:hypothetical protein